MAMRLCPWMDGIPQGAMDGVAVMSMDDDAFTSYLRSEQQC